MTKLYTKGGVLVKTVEPDIPVSRLTEVDKMTSCLAKSPSTNRLHCTAHLQGTMHLATGGGGLIYAIWPIEEDK